MLPNRQKRKQQETLLRNREWKRSRIEATINSLTCSNGPLYSYPFIEDGLYHWQGVQDAIKLDLVFNDLGAQDLPLAVIVTEHYYGKYDETKDYMPPRDEWELYMRKESERIHTCGVVGFPVLVITPDDPIDEYSLSLAIEAVLNQAGTTEEPREEE